MSHPKPSLPTSQPELHLDWLPSISTSEKNEAISVPPEGRSSGRLSNSRISGCLHGPLVVLESSGPSQSEAPSALELGEKLFAVHATDHLPRSGRLIAGARDISGRGDELANEPPSFRPTLHFSLGSLVPEHGRSSWEDKNFAVMTPLNTLKDQLVNVSPHDTFVMGDFALPQGSILLVPEGTQVPEFPEGVTVKTYSAHEKLRSAIDRSIAESGGWNISMPSGSVSIDAQALLDKQDINTPEFFKNFLAENPKVGFGTHVSSTQGNGHRFGAVEQCVNLLSRELEHGISYVGSSSRLYSRLFDHHLGKLDSQLEGMPEEAQASYAEKRNRAVAWKNLSDIDLEFRDKFGKTYAGNREHFEKAKALRSDPEAVRSGLLSSVGQLRAAPPPEPISVSGLVQALHSLPPTELREFAGSSPEVFEGVDMPEFYAKYGIERTILLGHEAGRVEGLPELIERAVEAMAPPQGQERPLVESLESFLARGSNRLGTALEVMKFPAVHRRLQEHEGISYSPDSALDLDRVIEGNVKCAPLFKTQSLSFFSPMDQVAAEVLQKLESRSTVSRHQGPPESLKQAESQAFFKTSSAERAQETIKTMQEPLNTARRLEGIGAGSVLSWYEQQRRNDPSVLWEKLGLSEQYQASFPDAESFWSSQKSLVEVYLELTSAS